MGSGRSDGSGDWDWEVGLGQDWGLETREGLSSRLHGCRVGSGSGSGRPVKVWDHQPQHPPDDPSDHDDQTQDRQ